jgi:Ca2+-binding EF-hand superfamily protein
MKSIFPLIAAALAISMAAPAFAEGPGGKGRMFEEADTNGDGVISQAEHSAFSAQRSAEMFSKMDADGDGSISKEEAMVARKHMRDMRKERRGDQRPQ